jgi:hypothetical protein
MGKDVKLINENTLFNVHLGREEKETWSNLYRDTECMFTLWQHRQRFVQGMFDHRVETYRDVTSALTTKF